MKIQTVINSFINKTKIFEKADMPVEAPPSRKAKESSPAQSEDISVSYSLKEVRTKAKENNGKQALLDEMRFIIDEISKNIDDIDINKLTKSFLTVHNMDYKMKYMMAYFASKGIKPSSVLYKHLTSFFYTAEGRTLFDNILAAVNPENDFKKIKVDDSLLIDYGKYCGNNIEVIDDFFTQVSTGSTFSPEQLTAIYTLPSFRRGTAAGNSELMIATTGLNCMFKGDGDIAINNNIKLKLKAPASNSPSSYGKFTGGIFRGGEDVIAFITKVTSNFITGCIKEFNLDKSDEIIKALYDSRTSTFAVNPQYRGKYDSIWDIIKNIWQIISERHDNPMTLDNIRMRYSAKARRFIIRLFENAWTTTPNKNINNIVSRYFDPNFTNSGIIISDPKSFINEVGISFLMLYANNNGKKAFTHLGVFNGKLDNSAKLVIIPMHTNGINYDEILRNTAFVCPDTSGSAGRRTCWGIMC